MVVLAPSNLRPRPHLVWKRETHGEKAVASAGAGTGSGTGTGSTEPGKSGFQKFEDKIGISEIASKTGVSHWAVFGTFIVVLLVVVGLIGWCVFRFLRKKRPGDHKKGGKGEKGAGDEEGLVDNEEEDLKEEEAAKPNSEYLGKLQYELRYDFNTQTLVVKVVQVTKGFNELNICKKNRWKLICYQKVSCLSWGWCCKQNTAAFF